MFIYLPMYGIYMENERIQKHFDVLLEHRCKFCKENAPIFPTFPELKTHVQRNHELFACDLCTENIKVNLKMDKLLSAYKGNQSLITYRLFNLVYPSYSPKSANFIQDPI